MIAESRPVSVSFNRDEYISVSVAAQRCGVSQQTIRNWCRDHSIGRQLVANGPFLVSKPALEMWLRGDHLTLGQYHHGDRESADVMRYFTETGCKTHKEQNMQNVQSR